MGVYVSCAKNDTKRSYRGGDVLRPQARLRQECMKFYSRILETTWQPVEEPMSLVWWEQNCGKSINSINDQLNTPPVDNSYCTNLMVIPYSHKPVSPRWCGYCGYLPKVFTCLKNCSLPMNNT